MFIARGQIDSGPWIELGRGKTSLKAWARAVEKISSWRPEATPAIRKYEQDELKCSLEVIFDQEAWDHYAPPSPALLAEVEHESNLFGLDWEYQVDRILIGLERG